MKKLELSRHENEVVEQALDFWKENGHLGDLEVNALKATIDQRSFDWKTLARYAFWVALASLILSVISLFSDNTLEQYIQRFYDTPNVVFCVMFAGIAVLFYYLGFRNKKLYPEKTFSNETLMLAGSFSTTACIGFLGQIIDRENNFYSILFFISIIIYAVLSVKLQSKLIWVFTLVALGIWFATETAHRSDWGWSFWGMNYPLRFTLFGIILTACAVFIQPKVTALKPFKSLSVVIGLLYTMIALWCLSIFGNYSDLDSWNQIRQYEILYWGILAIALSLGLAIYGLKRKDTAIRDIGFVFFLLNLYTRFVEYLWDNINRTIFFLLLAISFWIVGRWSEKVWKNKKAQH